MSLHTPRALSAVCAAIVALSTTGYLSAAMINEIRVDQPSADNDEYFELSGTPGESLDDLTYLVIGDGTGGSGVIEAVVNLTGFSIPSNGYFLAAESSWTGTFGRSPDATLTLDFENSDNVTHLLVSAFTGALADDLDTDDDGTLDSMPWTSILDSLALSEDVPAGDQVYSSTIVGPDGSFAPGHVYRLPNHTGEWRIGAFGGGDDTAGTANVPEPASVALVLLAGLAAASSLRRRATN